MGCLRTPMITREKYNELMDEKSRLEAAVIHAEVIVRLYREGNDLKHYPGCVKMAHESISKTAVYKWIVDFDKRIKAEIKARELAASSDVK